MLHELLVVAIAYIVPLTELLGVAVVSWGSLHGLLMLSKRIWRSLNKSPLESSLRDIRIAIGEKMALGLDFFLAGDIIGTIVVPSKDTLLLLGGGDPYGDGLFPGQGNREENRRLIQAVIGAPDCAQAVMPPCRL